MYIFQFQVWDSKERDKSLLVAITFLVIFSTTELQLLCVLVLRQGCPFYINIKGLNFCDTDQKNVACNCTATLPSSLFVFAPLLLLLEFHRRFNANTASFLSQCSGCDT